MDLQLRDKGVLVTGGTKGIGRVIVREFLAEGAKVVTVGRSSEEGQRFEIECHNAGLPLTFVEGDVAEVAACRAAIDATIMAGGRLDVLVNNVGVNDSVGLDAGPEAFRASLERNLVHCYTLAHLAREELKSRRGAIVNVGSKVSVTGQGKTSGYAAAKGAINALTREWAVDLAQHSVRVNCVIPAEVWTPLYENWLKTMPDPAAARKRIESLIPLGRRFTTAEEIAAMVVFLASPRSSHTTGQIVFVDGGYTHLDRRMSG
jgi:NAD(P)-dependent dehydrogenase (short-subunit alcohol dehydrogenase family)